MVRFKNGVRVLEVHGRPQKTIRAEIERRYEGQGSGMGLNLLGERVILVNDSCIGYSII